MEFSSAPHKQNEALDAFSGIEPPGVRRGVCESSKVYDVFINHRGPDVKQIFATRLYNCLEQLGIRVFLDSQEKELGNSFSSTIEAAIRSSKVHIAIFSPRYAESPWCLAELALMLQSQAKIIPVFYQVKPSDLRRIKRGPYGNAFVKYKKEGRYLEKLNTWKEALHSLSYIAGEEFSSFSLCQCQKIVEAVQKEVQVKTCLHVAEYPVGLQSLVKDFESHFVDELVEDFEVKCGLKNGSWDEVKFRNNFKSESLFDVPEGDVGSQIHYLGHQLFKDPFEKDSKGECPLREGEHKVKVVGIFGMGGTGKSTLAKELFNRKNLNYKRASFLFDVREQCVTSQLPSLQRKLLRDLFDDRHLNFTSSEEGISYLKDRLQRSHLSNFLIIVDDIDHVEQLNALAVRDIINNIASSLVIVTTRDEGVLIAAGIAERYCLKGLEIRYGRELFCWHAFDQPLPYAGYEALVDSFVGVCGGLPLSLQILGRHVRGRTMEYWRSELTKASVMLHRDVKRSLRISFESLDADEKQVFMDVACFFVGKPMGVAERICQGSGWNARNAIEILKDKCLLEIDASTYQKPVLRMHDHLRDLGRELANEFSPPHRLWRPGDLKPLELRGFESILSETNIRFFHSIFDKSMGCQVSFFLGQPNNRFENSASLLWLELERLQPPIKEQSHILSWIPCLNLREERSIPTWIPLQNLQCLKIQGEQLKTLWNKCIQAPSQLKELRIFSTSLKEFPDFVENVFLENEGNSNGVKAPMDCLEKIEISGENCVSSILISGIHYPRLKSIKLHGMENLQEVNLTGVNTLNCLDIESCQNLKKLTVRRMECLETINIDINVVLRYFELDGCQILKTIDLNWNTLAEFSIRCCPKLPAFIGPCRMERIIINGIFECLILNGCRNLRSVLGNLEASRLYVRDCPQLVELSSLARVSCLDGIVIDSCENLGNVSGMDELHVSEYMRLCYCSNAVIRTCIHKLKSAPSDYTLVIGRAADGAESRSNEYLFGDGNIGVDGGIEIGIRETYLEWSALSAAAVILCFVVGVDSSISLEDINESLQLYVYGYVYGHGYGYRYNYDYSIQLHEGEWIITMVAWDDWSYLNIMGIEDVLREKGIMKKGFRVVLEKGEEWKLLDVLRTLIDKLYGL